MRPIDFLTLSDEWAVSHPYEVHVEQVFGPTGSVWTHNIDDVRPVIGEFDSKCTW